MKSKKSSYYSPFSFFVGWPFIKSYKYNIYLRTQDEGENVAWYVWLTAKTVSETHPKDQFTNLVWSDEFSDPGALDSSKWVHEVGDSWYNNEVQSYTSRLDNSKVEDGKIKIIAKKESYNGNNYTSARIISNTKDMQLYI